MRARAVAALAFAAAACSPNPRTEIPDIAAAALAELPVVAPGRSLCVERTIAQWHPAGEESRLDPPAPPGFAELLAQHRFPGGGGLKGDSVAGVPVRHGVGCFDLRGPLVAGDRAMITAHLRGVGLNLWLRRVGLDWRVVATTTSPYRE
jgi:hypothetical protein